MWIVPFVKKLLSSLGRKAPTHTYPYAPMPKDPSVRGHVEIDIGTCIFCNICVRKCPTDAITVDRKLREWEISHFQCIVCGECVTACPKKCLFMRPELARASDIRTKEKVVGAPTVPAEEKPKAEKEPIAVEQAKEPVTADA